MPYAQGDYLDLTVEDARRQWASLRDRRPVAPGSRQVAFLPVETLACLAATYLVDHSRFGSSSAPRAPEPVPTLARLFRRPPSSILAKMANLDGSRSHGATYDLLAGVTLRADPERMADTYRIVLVGARAAGLGPDSLPDFLRLEHGGHLELLGQDELTTSALEHLLDRELRRRRQESALEDLVTERLLLASVRVGQHRFAGAVMENCGRACVFCGFAIDDQEGPSLLRASHIKPWRDSNPKERLDVANGVAACPTHDAAFDIGLLTLGDDLTVRRSDRLRAAMEHNDAVRQAFDPQTLRASIRLPRPAVLPTTDFLTWHRTHVFAA